VARLASGMVVVTYASVMFNTGGNVRRWADSTQRGFTRNAKRFAPVRSGELRAGITGQVSRVGPKQLDAVISSTAPHTLFVLGGTTGPIYANRYWRFTQRTGLRVPRGGLVDPSMPYTSRWNFDWLREKGYMLKVREGNGYPQRYSLRVSGQEPNNFFGKAAEATAVRHPSLRGWYPIPARARFH